MHPLLVQQMERLPETLAKRFCDRYQDFCQQNSAAGLPELDHPQYIASLATVWSASDFVYDVCLRTPTLVHTLFNNDLLTTRYTHDRYKTTLATVCPANITPEAYSQQLRIFRNDALVRIAWRDLAGFCNFEETCHDLSALADACLALSTAFLYQKLSDEEGTPRNEAGDAIPFFILGLGKLGGNELNFSSDVDLLFTYPEEGKTDKTGATNQEFFTRLARRLINMLHARTEHGFVYRVDMRLRPFGESGAIVSSFKALKYYVQTQARQWERYPYLKARIINLKTNITWENQLQKIIREFVYVPYVDYNIIDTLREMKSRINREVERKNLRDNIKIGRGGIREIEFIAQCKQLIRGGRDARLRERNLLQSLHKLANVNLLFEETRALLANDYVFLRRVENCLQMNHDQQTHQLPDDPLRRQQLIDSLEFDNWESFATQLEQTRENVHRLFQKQVAKPSHKFPNVDLAIEQYTLVKLWKKLSHQHPLTEVEQHSDTQKEVVRLLSSILTNKDFEHLSSISKNRLEQIMPLLLAHLETACDKLVATLTRISAIIDAMMRRSYYLTLLLENPIAIEHLATLCQASPWISEQLASFPLLLDELRDSRTLYAPWQPEELDNELRQLLIALPSDDLDAQMECLREFKRTQVLRVAAADTAHLLPLMKVSDHLTFTASVLLQSVLEIGIRTTCRSYEPPISPALILNNHGFAIIAYGKLGGIELGYGSDLDLVFLYDEDYALPMLKHNPQFDSFDFYRRLVKNIIHIVSTPTSAGTLYPIDLRLRPSGNSGLLVTSLRAFTDYQNQTAWTWEHQALVRARLICGNPELNEKFELARKQILSKPKEPDKLRRDIIGMREKMQQSSKPTPRDCFDLKLSKGGITDIEFIIQYAVLQWANKHPCLLTYSDNIRIAEQLAGQQLLSNEEAALICDAYCAYRRELHHLDLQNQPTSVPLDMFTTYRDGIMKLWEKYLLTA